MVEVYVVVPSEIGDNFYALLTGRWYVGPTDTLWLEVATYSGSIWTGKEENLSFVSEASIREIQGEFV